MPPAYRNTVLARNVANGPDTPKRIDAAPEPKPTFRLTRYFSITSFFGVLVVLAVLLFFYQHLAFRALEQHETRDNIAITQIFASTLWPAHALFVKSASAIPKDELRHRPEIARIRQDVVRQMTGLSVVKVKIYNLDGLTVFSSDPAQIGEDKSTNSGFLAAKAGMTASEITFRDHFDAFEGEINDRNLISSYIPIRTALVSPVEGVMEVYSDVTEYVTDLEKTTWEIIAVILGSLTLLYLFLAAIVRRAELVIRAQNEEVRESEIRLHAVIDAANDGIIVIDGHGIVESLNPAAESIFGYAAAEVVGQNVKMLMPEPDHEDPEGRLEHYRATDEARTTHIGREVVGRRKDGSTFPLELAVSRMQLGDERHFTNIVRDITERKRAEQALVVARDAAQLANRAKDSFLATTSHEIRTPLVGLVGMLELLGLTPLNDEQRETQRAARDSGRSLLRILDDLLDWSKIEEGKLELAPRPTSIAELVVEVVNTYAHVASGRSLVLERQVDARMSPVLIVDPLRLSQVINNFVSNALKFTHEGRVEVRAELLGRREGAEQVRFSVRDTGIGIDEEVQQRLFQSYGQGSAETARMYGGTGLGLAICRRLADLLDGQIEVESAPGRGSTFSITLILPVSEAAVEQVLRTRGADAAAAVPPLVPAAAQAEAPLVLVVDDHPINRRLLAQQLRQLGLRAETAENGEAALPMWRDGRFALVITDCHMPKMDGYALAQAIRGIEIDEARPRTPIIAWTANVLAEKEDNWRVAGMDELLVKPTELMELRTVLSKWLAAAMTKAVRPADAGHGGAEGTQAAPIDLAALDQFATSETDKMEILRDFMAQIRSDLAEIGAALNSRDLPATGRLAHRMKGACRMVGARELETACEALQGAASQSKPEAAGAVKTALDRAMARLDAYLDQNPGANGKEQ